MSLPLKCLRGALLTVGLATLAASAIDLPASERQASLGQLQAGLIRNAAGASDGYVLFGTRSGPVFLIDKAGNMVHEWTLPRSERARFCLPELLPNGQLLVKLGNTTIATVDAAGEVVWRYDAPARVHHDHVALPNGNVLLLLNSLKSREEALTAGANPAFVGAEGLLVDHLIEVRPKLPFGGEVVWRWSPWDHLVQNFDPDKPNHGIPANHPGRVDLNFLLERLATTERLAPATRKDWLHVNAIDYHTAADHVLLLARHFGELWVVDHSTTTAESAGSTGGRHGRGGELLWRWGNPRAHGAGTVGDQRLFWPHAAHWIPAGLPGAGNILLFNNGDEFEGLHRSYSEVLELAYPLRDAKFGAWPAGEPQPPAGPLWRYVADPPSDFFSLRTSNARRLGNGNTLIVSGLRGTLFEVTPEGGEVWRYVSPVVAGERRRRSWRVPFVLVKTGFQMAENHLYRAFEYPRDYPGLKALDLTPKGTLALPPGNPPAAF